MNSCSRCTSNFTSLLLVMLMVLSVISNGNCLSYTSVAIASVPVFVSASTSSRFAPPADPVQIKSVSSASSSAVGAGGGREVSTSLASSSALSPSLPSSSSSSGSSVYSSSSSSSLPGSSVASLSCDFDTFSPSGCEDDTGSFCDSSQKCSCKDDHPIRLLGYCLKLKQIGEECYTSAQCKSINNAACYIFGKEYDNERISGGHNVGRQVSNWPTGNCRCNLGHQWDNVTETCIKKTIGSWCNDDWDCIKDKYNTQCSRPQNVCECAWGFFYDLKSDSCQTPKLWGQKCISNVDCEAENFICSPTTFKCVCPSGFHFDAIHPGCKVNADSSCERGYRWDEMWGRCIPNRSPSAVFPSLTAMHGVRTKSVSTGDHSGSSVNTSKSDSNSESNSSIATMLILILPNVIAFALILRYCYYRKREEDSSDLTDDLERGSFAIRSAHLHNLTKFCAYPPYTSTTRTILPDSGLKGHHGSCLATTVVSYTGDMAIGTCCSIAAVTTASTAGKITHGKSVLESVEETDEPVGSLNQETPEGENVSHSSVTTAAVHDEKEIHKSSALAAGNDEEHKSAKDDHSSCSPPPPVSPSDAVDDDALVICAGPSISSPSSSLALPGDATTSSFICKSPVDSSKVNSGQEDTIKSLDNSPTVVTRDTSSGNLALSSTTTGLTSSCASPPPPPSSSVCAMSAAKHDKKESDLSLTMDGINVKAMSVTPPLVHSTTSPKVTLVRYSPNSSANKVELELVDDSGETVHHRPVNIESYSSSVNFTCDNIDRQSSHFVSREKATDPSYSPRSSARDAASKSSVSCCSTSPSQSSTTTTAIAVSPSSSSRKVSPSHEQVMAQQDAPTS